MTGQFAQRFSYVSILLVLLYTLDSATISATIITVPGDQPTIQAGIDAASDGDTISIAPGDYFESTDLSSKTLRISAADETNPPTLHGTISVNGGQTLTTVISDIRFTDARGVTCQDAAVTIQRCHFENIRGGSINGQLVHCVNAGGRLLDNTFVNDTAHSRSNGNLLQFIGSAHPAGLELSGNTFIAPYGNAVFIREQSNVRIHHNVFAGFANFALVIHSGSGRAHDNTFANNGVGTKVLDTGGVVVPEGVALPADYQFINNVYVSNSISAHQGAESGFDYNLVFANGGGDDPGLNGIVADPIFFNPEFADYRIFWNSPAIDAGDPALEFNDPDGTRADIGAFSSSALSLPLPLEPDIIGEVRSRVRDHTPTFVWNFTDTIGSQVAYEFEVGSDNDWRAAEMWSSGQVNSATSATFYTGAPLLDGESYFYRVRLNNGTEWGDWMVSSFRMNASIEPPQPILPLNSSTANIYYTRLLADSIPDDPDGDPISYQFSLYSDETLSTLMDTDSGIVSAGLPPQTKSFDGLVVGQQYWWRSRSFDSFEFSDWSATQSFVVREPGLVTPIEAGVSKMSDALAYSGPGDTILVGAGTHTDNLVFRGNNCAIVSVDGPKTTILTAEDPSRSLLLLDQADDSAVHIEGLTIDGTGMEPIQLALIRNGARLSACANIFRDHTVGHYTIQVAQGEILLERNLFYNNQGLYALFVNSGSATTIINNTFDNNEYGVNILSDVSGDVRNNIITNSSEWGLKTASTSLTADYNLLWNNTRDYIGSAPFGANDVSSDPLFRDPGAGDYSLQIGSPAIDAGDPDTLYSDVDGSRNDIGAHSATGSLTCCVNPGDVNDDLTISIADVTFLISRIFAGGPAPPCAGQGDADGSASVNIADVIFLINHIFSDGAAPTCP